MKPGDLIGFSGYDLSGLVINLGTFGIPFYNISHIGIIAEHHNKLMLFESTTLCELPCLIQGEPVSGAQAHCITSRIDNYNGRTWHYPLSQGLTCDQSYNLTEYLLKDIGKEYDMLGAIRSGGWLFSSIENWFRGQDLNNLFCSEWVASAHHHIDLFRTRSSSRWNPNSYVRETYRRGITNKPRLI
jgi:hypothetical protein